jgi:hypothetical protein
MLAVRSGERWQCFVSLPWLRELFSVLLIWVRLSRALLVLALHSRSDSKQPWEVTYFHYVPSSRERISYSREQKYKRRHGSTIAPMVLQHLRGLGATGEGMGLRVGLVSDDDIASAYEKCTPVCLWVKASALQSKREYRCFLKVNIR